MGKYDSHRFIVTLLQWHKIYQLGEGEQTLMVALRLKIRTTGTTFYLLPVMHR